jgi:hypothetical protein
MTIEDLAEKHTGDYRHGEVRGAHDVMSQRRGAPSRQEVSGSFCDIDSREFH